MTSRAGTCLYLDCKLLAGKVKAFLISVHRALENALCKDWEVNGKVNNQIYSLRFISNASGKKDTPQQSSGRCLQPRAPQCTRSVLTCPEKCSTGEKLMPWWAGRLEKSGRGKTSPRKSRCPEPAQWHRRASPAQRPADPQRQERQWNSWFLFSCEWKSIRMRRGEGPKKGG